MERCRTGSRLTTLLVVLALVALPAVALRAFCVGKSCDTGEAVGERRGSVLSASRPNSEARSRRGSARGGHPT